MKQLFNLFFMAAAMFLLPACNDDPDFIKNAPPASGEVDEGDDPATGDDTEEGVDPNFQIYLCFGQSNMEGFAALDGTYNGIEEQDKTVDERFQMMAVVSKDWDREAGHWYAAVPPLCRYNTGLCPADYFGRTMVEKLSETNPDVKIGVIVVAIGGAGIKAFHKTKYYEYYTTSGAWQQSLMNLYNGYPYGKLVEMAKIAQKQGVIKGILMHQGETDGCGEEWRGYVADIYNGLVEDLSLKANETPLLVGELLDDQGKGLGEGRNADLLKIAELVPNTYVVSSEGCTVVDASKDHNEAGENNYLHFSSEGYRELGRHYAETMLAVLEGQQPEEPVETTIPVSNDCFDFSTMTSDLEGQGRGSWDAESGKLVTSEWGLGGWIFTTPVDFTAHRYLVVEFKEAPAIYCQVAFYSDGRDVYGKSYCVGASKRVVVDTHGTYTTKDGATIPNEGILDMASIKMFGIQTGGDESGVLIDRIYVTDEVPGDSEEPGETTNPVSNSCFDFETLNSDLEGKGRGSWDNNTGKLVTSEWGLGGWVFDTPLDFTASKYLVVEFKEAPTIYCQIAFYSDGRDVYGKSYCVGASKRVVIDTHETYTTKDGAEIPNEGILDMTSIKMFGIQTNGNETGVLIDKIYVTDTNPDGN